MSKRSDSKPQNVRLRMGRATAAALLGCAITVFATVALESFLDAPGRGAHWSEAITAIASIVLVVVTVVYVIFTGSLARLQAETLATVRRADFDRAVRRVMEDLVPILNALARLRRKFPIDESQAPSSKHLSLDYADLDERRQSLRLLAMQLPGALAISTLEAATRVADAVINVQTIKFSILRAEGDANGEGEASTKTTSVTWDAVRGKFYDATSAREGLGRGNDRLPEWKDVATGLYVSTAYKAVDELENTCSSWLRSQD